MPVLLYSFLLSLLLLVSCADTVSSLPQVTVSISPLRYFVQSIGGDKVKVNVLVPSGASPETYEPTPKQLIEASESHAYFNIGLLPFEQTRLKQITENAPHLRVISFADSVTLLENACQHHHHVEEDTLHHGQHDLHLWSSFANAKVIARGVYHQLCAMDSTERSYFRQNYDSLLLVLEKTEQRIRQQLAPLRNRVFLIYHPALAYYAQEFGLHQVAVEQDGKEPSAATMQRLINQVRTERIHTIFIQEEHEGRAALRIAESTQARVAKIAPLSAQWLEQMQHIARELLKGEKLLPQ